MYLKKSKILFLILVVINIFLLSNLIFATSNLGPCTYKGKINSIDFLGEHFSVAGMPIEAYNSDGDLLASGIIDQNENYRLYIRASDQEEVTLKISGATAYILFFEAFCDIDSEEKGDLWVKIVDFDFRQQFPGSSCSMDQVCIKGSKCINGVCVSDNVVDQDLKKEDSDNLLGKEKIEPEKIPNYNWIWILIGILVIIFVIYIIIKYKHKK
jgi:hypothetical protein